jgi:hypothetical protein
MYDAFCGRIDVQRLSVLLCQLVTDAPSTMNEYCRRASTAVPSTQVRESSAFAGGNDDTLDIIDFSTALLELDCASDTAVHAPAAGALPAPAAKCSLVRGAERCETLCGTRLECCRGDAQPQALQYIRVVLTCWLRPTRKRNNPDNG